MNKGLNVSLTMCHTFVCTIICKNNNNSDAVNPLYLPVAPLWKFRIFIGWIQLPFKISSSQCINTSANMSSSQFKMDDSVQKIFWLGWYSPDYFVRNGAPVITNQIALRRLSLPLLSLEYTQQSSSQRVLEAQLWQCCLRIYRASALQAVWQPEENTACTHTPWNLSVLIHNDKLI